MHPGMSIPCIYGGHVRLELNGDGAGLAFDEIVQGAHAIFMQHGKHNAPQTAVPWQKPLTLTVKNQAVHLYAASSTTEGAEKSISASSPSPAVRLPLSACLYVHSLGANIYLVLRETRNAMLCHRLRFQDMVPVQMLLREINGVLAQLPDDDNACAPAPVEHPDPYAALETERGDTLGRRRQSASWAVGAAMLVDKFRKGWLGSFTSTLQRAHQHKHERQQHRARRHSSPPTPLALDAVDAPLYDVRTMAGLVGAPATGVGTSHASLDSGWDSDGDGSDIDSAQYATPYTPPLQRHRRYKPGHKARLAAAQARAATGAGVVSIAPKLGHDEGVCLYGNDTSIDDNALAVDEAEALNELRAQPYYHGHVDFAAAEKELQDAPPGAYLIRAADEAEENFVISVVNGRNSVSHLGILHFSGRYHVTGCASERAYSIKALLDRHVASGALLSGCHLYQFIPCLSK